MATEPLFVRGWKQVITVAYLCLYDVGNKSHSNRNDKQKAQNEIAEKPSTTAFNVTKLGHITMQLVAVVRVITLHAYGATQLDATDSGMFKILRLAKKPTKSVVVQLSRAVQ